LKKKLIRKKKVTQEDDKRVSEVIKYIKENFSDELREKYVIEESQKQKKDEDEAFEESSEDSDQEI